MFSPLFKKANSLTRTCKALRKGFNGGYRYRQLQVAGDERYTDEPDKNQYSHIHDAAQYACSRFSMPQQTQQSRMQHRSRATRPHHRYLMTDFEMGNPAEMGQEDDARLQQAQQIEALTSTLLRRRREAIEGRAASGIEAIWIEDENQYNGVDEYNAEAGSNEFAIESGQPGANRSTVFLNVTQPKTDAAEARVADMLLPVDNKPWGLKPTPIPELSKLAADKSAQYTLPDGQQVPASEIANIALEEAQKAADRHEKLIEDQQIDCNWAEVTRSMIPQLCATRHWRSEGAVPGNQDR